jgi:hypothetical protein
VTAACSSGPEFTNNGGGCTCSASNGFVIRPQITNANWGGGGATSAGGECLLLVGAHIIMVALF